LSPVSLGTRDEKQAMRQAAVPWAQHRSVIESLERGRANVGEAKRFFRATFEREDVRPVRRAEQEREAAIGDLAAEIEVLELRIAASADATSTRRDRVKLALARRHFLRHREARARDRHETSAAIRDLASGEIGDAILDQYVDELVKGHPQPVDMSPLGRQVRSELREIARSEAIAALGRSVSADSAVRPTSPCERN
jgi:hypothetical protein